ncbi:MAG: VWA domain-containing protein, partial [Proteobacteria bacterium]|nr:VWA domain-containing protein [Pseudomonadota bacterium]
MQRKQLRTLFLLGVMIAVTCSALAYSDGKIKIPVIQPVKMTPVKVKAGQGIVTLSGNMVQNKVVYNGNGEVGLELTMTAADVSPVIAANGGKVDMVLVLDRSGSMQGDKINDARRAMLDLIDRMTEGDRLGIVSYANNAGVDFPLQNMTPANRERMKMAVSQIEAGGGTNLGEGLQLGLSLLERAVRSGNQNRLVLISDGLANQGITDPSELGRIAGRGATAERVTSTVGVGNDFNEILMTSLADHGTGKYYYLEDPGAFAAVFLEEFKRVVATVASGLEVKVPVTDGVRLVSAGGYPVTTSDGMAS